MLAANDERIENSQTQYFRYSLSKNSGSKISRIRKIVPNLIIVLDVF